MTMSEQAKSALINTQSSKQGSVPQGSREVFEELRSAGLVGIQGGLTRKGTIERERIVNATLDELF